MPAPALSGAARRGRACRDLAGLERAGSLPSTVIYNVDPGDNALFATVAGAFAREDGRPAVRWGPAWWFNDHERGLRDQLELLGAQGVLGTFVGMHTDSRSWLSMTRDEPVPPGALRRSRPGRRPGRGARGRGSAQAGGGALRPERARPLRLQAVMTVPATVVVMGVAGAGKSTLGGKLAGSLGQPLIEADEFHSKTNIAKMRQGMALVDDDRWAWLAAVGAPPGPRHRRSWPAPRSPGPTARPPAHRGSPLRLAPDPRSGRSGASRRTAGPLRRARPRGRPTGDAAAA